MSAARGDRRATAAGGIVLVESGELRKQRERGELVGLSTKKRGPKRREKSPLAERVGELERDNTRLRRRAERAEGIVELQKKVSEIFGIELEKRVETD